MKTNVSQYDFGRAFVDMGRSDSFSYEGKIALFEWLEELSDDTGSEYELDVIALCCEFTEYENLAEFQSNYDAEQFPDIESIQDYTSVIEIGPYYPVMDESERPFIIADF